MSKSRQSGNGETRSREPQAQMPNNALSRITLGDSFAEYDPLLKKPGIFVSTNAFVAAQDPDRNKCFFIGRRGTGKTAITLQLEASNSHTAHIFPEVFAPLNSKLDASIFTENHQKPFKSVIAAFELSLQFELLYFLLSRGKIASEDLPAFAQSKLKIADNSDFDLRTVRFVERIIEHLNTGNDKSWLKDIKRPKILAADINECCGLADGAVTLILKQANPFTGIAEMSGKA